MNLIAAQAVIDGQLLSEVSIEISHGVITAIGTNKPADRRIEGVLIPGFVDIHCHGGGGHYFSDPSDAGIEKAIQAHTSHGTTSILASLVSEPIDNLLAQIKRLNPFINKSALRGIHLEGPYLAHSHCGAHDPALLRQPTIEELKKLIDASGNMIKMVTIAPELDGAIQVIEFLSGEGIIAALGHTGADAKVAHEAINAGATLITHFNNGMPKLNTGENINSVALTDQNIELELILDGHHINDADVATILKSAKNRVFAITDAMAAAGQPDGPYTIGKLGVTVKDSVARLDTNGALAGSTLTMDVAFLNLINKFGFSIPEAVAATSTRAAGKAGLHDAGSISVGKKADFVELSATGQIKSFS